MLEAAIFPQKYDGGVMPPEMNQGCSEGRRGGELRVHTEEAPMGGRWTCLAAPCAERKAERRSMARLWLDIVFKKLSFLLPFTAASLLCYGILVGK